MPMTAIQMYAELVSRGLFVASAPVQYVLPTAYQYIPTYVVYSSTVGNNAELESSSTRNQTPSGHWGSIG